MDYDRDNRSGRGIINPATGRPYGTLENGGQDPYAQSRGNGDHDDHADLSSENGWNDRGRWNPSNQDQLDHGESAGARDGAGSGKYPRQPKTVRYVSRTFMIVALIIAVAVSTVLGGLFGFWLYDRASSSSYSNLSNVSLESATDSEKTIEEIVSENEDSVVEITTESQQMSLFGTQTSEGAGSGVIVSEDGYIATNYHVIEGSSKVTVKLHSGDSYDAEVVGYDSENDLAVLKIDAKDLNAVTIGKSSSVKVGDLAVAIGNPLGTLGGTATSGIISSLDRELTIDGRKLSLLQTDSAINPGNSGGGLFDGSGKLIGIVVAKGSGTGIEGLGFAIPIDTAAPIINQIIEDAK